MSEDVGVPSGKIEITSSSIDVGRDMVGGDYTVNYIINNQYLDLRAVLIALTSTLEADFEWLLSRAAENLKIPSNSDISAAIRVATDIISGLLSRHKPKIAGQAFLYDNLLADLHEYLGTQFQRYRYWDKFGRTATLDARILADLNIERVQVIPLLHLQRVWRDVHDLNAPIFAIASVTGRRKKDGRVLRRFRMVTTRTTEFSDEWFDIQDYLLAYPRIGIEDFRFFITGIVIDLMMYARDVKVEIDFLENLTRLTQQVRPDGE